MSDGIFLNGVSFRYSGSDGDSLSNISFHIPKGSFFGITGSNGSGKTTLAYILNGLIPNEIDGYLEGQVTIDGNSTSELSLLDIAKKVGFVFQNPEHMIFNLSVYEEIEFGLKNFNHQNIPLKISEALKVVGLEGYEKRDPNELSLGQKQKVCIASILALNPEYIILDEPSSMLDFRSSLNLYNTLQKISKSGKTVIVIEHDTDFILTYADHCLILNNAKLESFGKSEEVLSERRKLQNLGIKIPRKITEEI
ncbi:MAG: ABC transporter ATP-binding protein [Patescibacteria group bacterium]